MLIVSEMRVEEARQRGEDEIRKAHYDAQAMLQGNELLDTPEMVK